MMRCGKAKVEPVNGSRGKTMNGGDHGANERRKRRGPL